MSVSQPLFHFAPEDLQRSPGTDCDTLYPPPTSFCSLLLSQAALLLQPLCSSISCIIQSSNHVRRDRQTLSATSLHVCVSSWRGGRRGGGGRGVSVLQAFPCCSNRLHASCQPLLHCSSSLSALSEPDTLTCLFPPLFAPFLSPSLCILSRAALPLLIITLPLLRQCSLLEGDTGLLLTHWFCMTVTKVRPLLIKEQLAFGSGWMILEAFHMFSWVKVTFCALVKFLHQARLSGCCCTSPVSYCLDVIRKRCAEKFACKLTINLEQQFVGMRTENCYMIKKKTSVL